MRLEGKVAVVTGAAQGLGRACAQCMAAEGAKLIVSDLNADGGEQVAAAIRDAGGEASFITCDVGDKAQVDALKEHFLKDCSRLSADMLEDGEASQRERCKQFFSSLGQGEEEEQQG